MTNKDFEVLEQIIRNRRSVKPVRMNGRKIADELIENLLELADWAPTHGRTEPWLFLVFEGESLKKFSLQHAELYRQNADPARFWQDKYDKLISYGEKVSHLIIAAMKRTADSKIKEKEEYAAVAASVQNILLGAAALGLTAMWNTGGMATGEEMKSLLHLAAEDEIVSFIYLGYTDKEIPAGIRKIPLEEKIIWNK